MDNERGSEGIDNCEEFREQLVDTFSMQLMSFSVPISSLRILFGDDESRDSGLELDPFLAGKSEVFKEFNVLMKDSENQESRFSESDILVEEMRVMKKSKKEKFSLLSFLLQKPMFSEASRIGLDSESTFQDSRPGRFFIPKKIPDSQLLIRVENPTLLQIPDRIRFRKKK